MSNGGNSEWREVATGSWFFGSRPAVATAPSAAPPPPPAPSGAPPPPPPPPTGGAPPSREFQELANGLARGLLGLGVRPGDAIALWLSPRPEALIAQFACYKLGVPLVPIDPAQRDLGEVLSQSDATALFLTEALPGLASPLETVYELLPELVEAPPGKLLSDRFPRLRHIVLCRGGRRYTGIFSLAELYTRGEGAGGEGR